MINESIQKIVTNHDLTFAEANTVMNEIMDGTTTPTQISAFLTALAMKHETVPEIAGAAKSMRDHALAFHTTTPVLEIVGTGGDQANTFNISTTSALVIAAAGYPVAKHGNRAASSKSGAADVLEALGVQLTLLPAQNEQILHDLNFCFLFAQEYHQAMRFVAPVRRELGFRTVFNILGPLTNPAHATAQVLGVYDAALLEPMANVLVTLGITNALVVHGRDGLDEITTTNVTDAIEIRGQQLTKVTIDPADYGLASATTADLVGGTPADNAAITRAVLNGTPGPQRDTVLLNAACGIHVADAHVSIAAGLRIAAAAIDSGKASATLDALIASTKAAQTA